MTKRKAADHQPQRPVYVQPVPRPDLPPRVRQMSNYWVGGVRYHREAVKLDDLERWKAERGLVPARVQPVELAGLWPPYVLYETRGATK